MSKEIITTTPSPIVPTQCFTQTGDNNVQTAGIKNLSLSQTIIFPSTTSNQEERIHIPTPDLSCFNLLILESCNFQSFRPTVEKIRKEVALTKSISDEFKSRFACLNSKAIEEITTFPSIFANVNTVKGKSDSTQLAFYGRVYDVHILDEEIEISFLPTNPIPQKLLNNIVSEIAVDNRPNFNEFDRTHWTIKPINIIEVLRKYRLEVMITI
ncbi:MAG: hypothetical protein PHI01_05975 [Candidatus Izemoplasmatales bacterium]|nr:hypothetical protein [Candidatus Cloacimonadota bacterium]MDD4184942.1 hypothetical protein [Candidatus Izemoplasmatales bacterium]